VEFVQKANEEAWLSESEEIQTSVHVAYLLEAFVASMANNNHFAKDLQSHMLRKRTEYGMKRDSAFSVFWKVLSSGNSLFSAVKIIAIDGAITSHLLRRDNLGEPFTKEEVERLYREGRLSYPARMIMLPRSLPPTDVYHDGCRINIYEAGIVEYRNGFADNAMSAHSLCESNRLDPQAERCIQGPAMPGTIDNDFYQSLSDENNILLCSDFSHEWNVLYETWNLAFILGELNDLHILFPKLLIPSVLSSKNEYFMTTRVFALWISINTLLFRRLDRVHEVTGPSERRAMVEAWGKINKKYAHSLARKSAGQDAESFDKGFRFFFNWPKLNLLKLITSY
jgi:hypothetical protein